MAKATASPATAALTSTKAWTVNFTGAAGTPPDPTLFNYETGGNGWGNGELETYTNRPQNASLDGAGDLAITMRQESYTGTDGIHRNYTSARLDTEGHWSFETGTLSARIKLPVGTGLWPAFWLLGTDIGKVGWPASGEIDIVEAINAASTVYSSVHGPDASGGGFWSQSSNKKSATGSYGSDFHIYTIKRSPGLIIAGVDGVEIGAIARNDLQAGQRWVFDEPMFVLFNLAVGGIAPGAPTSSTPKTASMLIDWVNFTP